jgi:hypothetical protein
MSKVHQLPKGASIAPMPKLVVGDVGRVLQGGLPPVPFRSCNAKWSNAAKFAREPMPYTQRKLCAENADWQHTHFG